LRINNPFANNAGNTISNANAIHASIAGIGMGICIWENVKITIQGILI
jgi:hypothetical protein